MNLKEVKDNKISVYYVDTEGKFFECFEDKSRKVVDKEKLFKRMEKNRLYDFQSIIVAENNLQYHLENNKIKQETMDLYKQYGIVS